MLNRSLLANIVKGVNAEQLYHEHGLQLMREEQQFTARAFFTLFQDFKMSADKDPEYLLGETKREVERLQKQHAWHKLCLGDKFVWAPVDLQKPGLKVLDVGCADGTLLRDLRQQVSASAQLVGVDVMSGFLPPTADGNISYAVGDVCEPPVPERSAVFDLALVRYTLAGAAAYGIDKAVANLVGECPVYRQARGTMADHCFSHL
jgi:SAM-dependent methyltransferase